MKKLLGIIVLLAAIVILGVLVSNRESAVSQNPNTSFIATDWEWQRTDLADGTKVDAPKNGKFAIYFGENNTFTGEADCNTIQGSYTLTGASLSVGPIASTKMGCAPESLEAEFLQELSRAGSHEVTDDKLMINLADNYGTMFFARIYKTLQPTPNDPKTTGLSGSTFRLTSYNGAVLPASQKYFLTFKDGKITTGFCNAVSGSYTIKNNVIKADLISTDMACSQPANVMAIENTFGSILQSGARFSLKDSTLTLTGNNNQELVFDVFTE